MVFYETNFTLKIIMFNHQMLPPFEICWQIWRTFWTAKPFWFNHILVAVQHMCFEHWPIYRCATFRTIQNITLMWLNTYHFDIFLIFFREKLKIWSWIDWIFFQFFPASKNINTKQLLVTQKIKYSFPSKQSENYRKSQNFHNSYWILNPILNTIGTLVANFTQIIILVL